MSPRNWRLAGLEVDCGDLRADEACSPPAHHLRRPHRGQQSGSTSQIPRLLFLTLRPTSHLTDTPEVEEQGQRMLKVPDPTLGYSLWLAVFSYAPDTTFSAPELNLSA